MTTTTKKSCPECGGGWSERYGRPYHAFTCSQNPLFRKQDEERAVLHDLRAPLAIKECGCSSEGHDIVTCSRFFEFYPDAEVGVE